MSAPSRHRRAEVPELLIRASQGNTERVKLLLSNGADVNTTDVLSNTALFYAIDCDKIEEYEIIKLLLEQGANINAQATNGFTPLIKATKKGDFRAVKMLLNANADRDIRTSQANRCPMAEFSRSIGFGLPIKQIYSYCSIAVN